MKPNPFSQWLCCNVGATSKIRQLQIGGRKERAFLILTYTSNVNLTAKFFTFQEQTQMVVEANV